MKKIGNILLLIAGIFGIIAAALLLIFAIVSFAGIGAAASQAGGEDAGTIALGGTVLGVVLLIALIPEIISIVFCFRARKVGTQGSYIGCLVLGILGGNILAIIGGVLGLVDAQ